MLRRGDRDYFVERLPAVSNRPPVQASERKSLKALLRPHSETQDPQRFAPSRPLVKPNQEAAVEERHDGIRHYALHPKDYAPVVSKFTW